MQNSMRASLLLSACEKGGEVDGPNNEKVSLQNFWIKCGK